MISACTEFSRTTPFRSPHFASFRIADDELVLCNVHLRWGSAANERPVIMAAIADGLLRKVERGAEFPRDLVLLGDVQGGSVGGRVLDAIEGAGFLLPEATRNGSTSTGRDDRPYDQIGLLLSRDSPFEVGAGGVFDFFEVVYTREDEDLYASELRDRPGRDFEAKRTHLMSENCCGRR